MKRALTDAKREEMIALRGQGLPLADIAISTGFSLTTVALVLRDGRDEGDSRADPDPAVRMGVQQRVAASATHREGGPSPGAPALAPNSMEASLIMRGMRPEVAAATARAWRDRHARNDARSRRTGDGSRHVVAKEG